MTSILTIAMFRDFIRNEDGGALVDLGLILSATTVVVIGLAETAAISSQSSRMSNATRAAVEQAIKDPSDVTAIKNVAARTGNFDPTTLSVAVGAICECPGPVQVICTATCSDGSTNSMYISVDITKQSQSYIPGGMMPTFTLNRGATMRVR